jgi:dihydrodipicolinate synthase/N-acetylneuraminate lyase
MPVELVGELAQHPNIIGIKDSTGDLERLRSLIEATRTAPRRSVPVTSVFEAVTARMLKPSAAETGNMNFVAAGDLAGGLALAAAPPAATLKTRSREVGFQVITGAASTVVESLEAGGSGAILGFAACAPQACHEIYSAWKDHDPKLAAEKQQRIAGAAKRVVGELGVSGVKYACDFNGYYGGRARLPLLPVSGEQKQEIESLLADIRN